MTATEISTMDNLLVACEDERCEFKAARNHFDFSKLADYCAALSNEGGGVLVLGVSDALPRRALGTQAFRNLQKTVADVTQQLRIKISAVESTIDGRRVITVRVPAHPIGQPIAHNGRYLMRGGEGLVPMTTDQLKRIMDETVSDYSATLAKGASLDDLHPDAIGTLRDLWARRSGDSSLTSLSDVQTVEDLGLTIDGEPTVAALVLLAHPQSLMRLLAQAEVVFEYRSQPSSLRYQQRRGFRQGFLLCHDDLWDAINARNDVHQIQEGLLVRDIAMFSEKVVREAILNAIAHRDYSRPGSIFIRQAPDLLEVVSPGGLPPGITTENMLWRQDPRNRRIADVLERCGLVDRSDQGVRRMLESCIRESKPRPDYSQTDEHQVGVLLRGSIRNPLFVRFLERVGEETLRTFSTRDFMVLDLADQGDKLPPDLSSSAQRLRDMGVVESVGRGRGTRYVLSRRYYQFAAAAGTYTRMRGLDRETNKQLLLTHVVDSGNGGCPLAEIQQVLPSHSRRQLQGLMSELRRDGLVEVRGKGRGARWFATARA
jgi:ATP-dependent DNA helicase RecG